MGYETEADEKRDSAVEHIKSAARDLGEIVIIVSMDLVAYDEKYYDKLCAAFDLVRKARDLLK